jgi:hypothetical protein
MLPRHESHTMSRRTALAITTLAAAATLGACVVVPIDPATGRPYPPHGRDAYGQSVTVVTPPPPVGGQPPAVTVLSARLYPLNQQANKGGMLTASVVDNNTGRGTFTIAYLGDSMQGEATRVDSGYASFGRIHNEVLGYSQRTFSGRRGIANAYGSKGVNVQCEYVVTGPTMGTGVCQFSDGAKYQMHFGT